MTAIALKEEAPAKTVPPRPGRLFDPTEVTLDELLTALAESLAGTGRARCPVCGGMLERDEVERLSRCGGCGSSLE